MTPEDFDELARAEDYRSIPRLRAMVFDTTLPESVRDRASRVLDGFDDTTTGEQRRTWWASDDPVVRKHAVRFMTRAEADILLPVACDDTHPMQARALASMGFGFREAEFMPVLIRALTHYDPVVRAATAAALYWYEPVAAETGLLAAAHDETFEVAAEAIDTLRYYPTQRVLRSVAVLRAHADRRIAEAATNTFDDLRDSFESLVTEGDPKAIARLRDWMRPVRDLVAWPEEITVRAPHRFGPRRILRGPGAVTESVLLALLDDPDVDREALDQALRGRDWTGYEPAARTRSAARLVAHPNPVVRDFGCAALADWGRSDDLMRLVGDVSSTVRKSAMYHLAALPAEPAVAELAWRYLPDATGTAAQETLRTYCAHLGPAAVPRLADLVRSDPREDVRYEGVHLLVKLHAADEIRGLADILAEPPGVTWAVHNTLLDGLGELGITVALPPHLAAADDRHLQHSLAEYLARQS
ncbi:HEAT repeat domain-containing protein [Nocardia seriolae]|uniref:HEAT repeat domain-containing protein n=1 Tax=Nocardia seriolae TaxID=37332 RepID=UPI001190B2E9|nr:HEAT repeat domain-containing protein [Nocardia seriolae]GEM27604.1 hypothetical protein NS2_58430 [Nocardia seriolae NBRC 15557]